MNTNQKKEFRIFPAIVTLSDACQVARQGTWAACFVAGMTAVFALVSIAVPLPPQIAVNPWALIDAVIFAVIAWGIYRVSRIAAIGALIYYIIGQVFMIAASVESDRKYSVGPIAILIILAFINSIRGTFAYHRLRKTEKSVTDSEINV